ncbi:MAG: PQQ-binding-like beta-propeller repeat protein [Gemmatimonadaceae bacterium]
MWWWPVKRIAVGDVDVYGYDKETGNLLWQYVGEPGDEPGRHRMLDGRTIFLGTFRGRAEALDPATGHPKWSIDLTAGDTSVSAFGPFIAGDELYVGTKRFDPPVRGSLYALDARTGATRWRYDFTPELPNLSRLLRQWRRGWRSRGRFCRRTAFAFERATGNVRWIAPAVLTGGSSRGGDDRLFVLAGSDILATSLGSIALFTAKTGQPKRTATDIKASIIFPPGVDAQRVFVSHSRSVCRALAHRRFRALTDPM